MTDKTAELDGFADVPLAERQAADLRKHHEIREGLLRRHFGVADENAALAGGALAADIEVSKALDGKG